MVSQLYSTGFRANYGKLELTPEPLKRRKTALEPSELWKALDGKADVEKMDQLLKLCVKRALSSRAAAIKEATNSSSGNLETLRFAKVVQDDLQAELDSGKINIDWNKRPASRAQVLNPNPQNEVNKRNCEELEARLRELESEKQAWEDQMAALDKEFGELPRGPEPVTDTNNVKISTEDIAKLRERLVEVERLVRELGDGTHRVDKVNAASRMFSDRKLQDMYSVLKAASPGDSVPSTQTLLRTLSRIA